MLSKIKQTIGRLCCRNKALIGYKKPKQFDYNLIVIGAGSAGLVSSYIAAAVKAKVLLIEKDKMGGDCLNSGCVPSKSLIRSSKFLAELTHSKRYGISSASAEFEFSKVMERVASVIKQIEPHDSVERYTDLGVECRHGEATIVSPWQVSIGEQVISAATIIIATGAKPRIPPISGLEGINYYTSDTIWSLRVRPERLLVVGAGPIGCELGQSFSRLGCEVTLVDIADRLIPSEDADAAQLLMDKLTSDGIEVKLGCSVGSFSVEQGQQLATIKNKAGETTQQAFDAVLFSVGRQANSSGMGLQQLGVQTDPAGNIKVGQYMRTTVPTIYACGDVTGGYQFTHAAAHYAWYSAVNSLFGTFWRFKADHRVMPRVTFTDPEIASVGYNEESAKAAGLVTETTLFKMSELDRAIVDGKTDGFVKVITANGSDKILGVTIAAEHAGEMLAEFVLAMKHGLGLNKLLGTIHAYPTWAEGNKYVAGVWKQNHKPDWLLNLMQRYHQFRRN